MTDIAIALDRSAPLGLQDQLRQRIIDAIATGALRPGCRLPSSRTLARRLGIARNTVVLAYGDLVAEGHLDARDRSGIFVSQKSFGGRVAGRRPRVASRSQIAERMASVPADAGARCPQHWRQYPYPFWDGRVDASLAPLQDWRRAVRLASCPRDTAQWSDGNGELDDAMLVEEIRSKVLPERGISALPEEVLVLASARQGLQFLVGLLVQPGTPVWLEAPVDPELLATLRERGARIESLGAREPVDAPDGVIVVTSARSGIGSGGRISPALVAAVTHANGVVIEHDTPPDTLEADGIRPALYASAGRDNIAYVACLSPAAACGTPLALVVADAAVIARLRRLRRISGAAPDPLLQRAWAYFLALGYYTSALQKARRVLLARRTALRDALNHYLHASVRIETMPGASAYWVHCRDGQDARVLAARAAQAGVLLQPARLDDARDAFSLGVTSIPEERIREGIRMLARVFRAPRTVGANAADSLDFLSGAALRRAIAGKTLLYNTVYGEPCTIRVCRAGQLVGMAGYANDDPDQGRWWIEDNHWFRKWDHWAYAEVEGFRVTVHGDQLCWYDAAGNLVDKAVILGKPRSKPATRLPLAPLMA